jgi:hypothetical protein
MSTNDVPGANPANADVLAMGCWAEHEDGSLILVEAVEAGTVVYSIFDVADTPVEYRDAMPEQTFKDRFSWHPDDPAAVKWTWHDKQPFPWQRVMANFPPGQRAPSAEAHLSAAARVARSLGLRAERIRERHGERPTMQRAATTIMTGIREAIEALTE